MGGLAIGLAVSLPLAIIATKRRGGPLDRVAVAVAAIPAYWLGLLLSCSLSFSSAGSLPRALAGTPKLFYPPSRSGRPGLGTFLITDIIARDLAYVQAVVVLTELVFVVVNLLIDIIYRVIDPRIGAETRSTLIVVTGLVALAVFGPLIAAYAQRKSIFQTASPRPVQIFHWAPMRSSAISYRGCFMVCVGRRA
ncbi:hypothetical protein [Roseobacter sp. EG26]|uniref:hypothetical protein n=1 Tax=Roseobacter sp. EG26 TaxID=3412477 RepID=UPI003CE50673